MGNCHGCRLRQLPGSCLGNYRGNCWGNPHGCQLKVTAWQLPRQLPWQLLGQLPPLPLQATAVQLPGNRLATTSATATVVGSGNPRGNCMANARVTAWQLLGQLPRLPVQATAVQLPGNRWATTPATAKVISSGNPRGNCCATALQPLGNPLGNCLSGNSHLPAVARPLHGGYKAVISHCWW